MEIPSINEAALFAYAPERSTTPPGCGTLRIFVCAAPRLGVTHGSEMFGNHAGGFLIARRQAAAQVAGGIAYGFRMDAPVVARLSRSIWAFAASFNA